MFGFQDESPLRPQLPFDGAFVRAGTTQVCYNSARALFYFLRLLYTRYSKYCLLMRLALVGSLLIHPSIRTVLSTQGYVPSLEGDPSRGRVVFTRFRGQAALFRGVLARRERERERRLGRDTELPSKREGPVVGRLSDPRLKRYVGLEESNTKRNRFLSTVSEIPRSISCHTCGCAAAA